MSDPKEGGDRPTVEPLDQKTRQEWLRMSAQAVAANAGPWPSRFNRDLDAAAQSEPQSPVAPAYRLWIADNLAREARYLDAVRAFDSAIHSAQSARRFLPHVDPTYCSLLHKAQAATLGGDARVAISTYQELAKVSSDAAEPLFQAGVVAEKTGDQDRAAGLYRSAAGSGPSSKTDNPAELARRALQRLEDPKAIYLPNATTLADVLARSLQRRDTDQLTHFLSRTHFAVGPLGGHTGFEEPNLLEEFSRDVQDSTVVAGSKLVGSGGKLYLMTSGWKGNWFRGDVAFLLTLAPQGWQWTGLGISQAHEMWIERWRPATRQTNQRPSFELLAPWPAGQSFKAGGLYEYLAQQLAGPILALIFARNRCGFGLRGFYYNQWTHEEDEAFAIDFTRYKRYVPNYPESGGTPVLTTRGGVVASVSAGTASGEEPSNTVEIEHEDPDNPTDTTRFTSRYLHLAGPFMIPVSEMMAVRTGQRLGLMDDTGNSVLDHLHFSIHDRNIPYPNVAYGASVRPTPLNGARLEDGDSGTCVTSTNLEYFVGQTGQLLFYRDQSQNGTGDVANPSVIGLGGWQTFQFLFSGGNGIIYAVDPAGQLLFYRDQTQDGTGDVANPSVIGLGGWQTFKFLFSGSSGIIYAVDPAGRLLFYRDQTQDGTGDVANPSVIGLGGWQTFKFLFSGGNGIIYAVDPAGRLLFYRDQTQDGTGDVANPSVIGLGGWQTFRFLFSGGNGIIYAVDPAGRLLFYRDQTQDGTGDVANPSVIGLSGWQTFKFLFSGGNGIIYAVPA